MLKTLAFTCLDDNSRRRVTTNTPNGAAMAPNRNFCKLRMTYGMDKKYTNVTFGPWSAPKIAPAFSTHRDVGSAPRRRERRRAGIPTIPGQRRKLLLHFRHTDHPWSSPKIAPAFSAYRPSLVIKKRPAEAGRFVRGGLVGFSSDRRLARGCRCPEHSAETRHSVRERDRS